MVYYYYYIPCLTQQILKFRLLLVRLTDGRDHGRVLVALPGLDDDGLSAPVPSLLVEQLPLHHAAVHRAAAAPAAAAVAGVVVAGARLGPPAATAAAAVAA